MTGLARMHEKGRGAGTRQRGRDLVTDMSRLAHAGDDDPAFALQQHVAGVVKTLIQPGSQGGNGISFGSEYGEAQLGICVFCHDSLDRRGLTHGDFIIQI